MHLDARIPSTTLPGPGALEAGWTKDKPLAVALHGDGPGASDLLRRLVDGNAHRPGLRLAGVATTDPECRTLATAARVPCYSTLAALAMAQPDLSALVLADDDAAPEVRQALGPRTVVLDAEAAGLLARVAAMGQRDEQSGSQTFLSTILDQLSDDVLLLDLQGRICDCNRIAHERRGLAKADLLGRPFGEAMVEDGNLCREHEDLCPFRKTLATARQAEATYTRVDDHGRLQYLRVYTYPIFGGDGEMIHVAELRRDITQRTEMEQRLRQSQKLAAIGELSTFLAHEIRNPLFSISGFANSLLRHPGLDDAARGKVEIILAESRRLDEILKAILNFAKPMESVAGEVDVAEVVTETMAVLALGCASQDIELRVEAPADLPRARGDRDLIKQCLINLVKNSVEAMPQGGRLFVRTGMAPSGVFLEVQDTGEGIPEENRELVFSPFFSTKEKGSGLGLAMIKKIAEDLGGEVELKSVTGRGTSVTMVLPPLLAVGMA